MNKLYECLLCHKINLCWQLERKKNASLPEPQKIMGDIRKNTKRCRTTQTRRRERGDEKLENFMEH